MQFSKRVQDTIPSAIGEVFHLSGSVKHNLAVGIPFWTPPEEILKEHAFQQSTMPLNFYGPIAGNAFFKKLLEDKISKKNKLTNRSIMVTAGANQGFFNICLTLLDPGDEVILFTPYYFNHKMALQLANVTIVEVPSNIYDEDHLFDIEAVKTHVSSRTRAVVLVSPSNPTGAIAPKKLVQELQRFCEEHKLWLISDEAYEDFIFEGKEHYSPDGPNVINLYSFSKSYGMSGWRCGYLAYPDDKPLLGQFLKVQDTIPIVTSQMTQRMGELALQKLGPTWVSENVKKLEQNRKIVWDMISQVIPESPKTSGGFYAVVKLPQNTNDLHAAYYLAKEHSVLTVPCSGCNFPGHLRVAYGFLSPEKLKEACDALAKGLEALKLLQGQDLSKYYTQ